MNEPRHAGESSEVVARFEVRLERRLAADGTAIGELPAFALEPDEMVAMYRGMHRTRAFDQKAIALQRTGRLGTYASSLGQEAVAIGVAAAMAETDVLVPSFREHGAQLWRGVTPVELYLYWGGDERGMDYAGPREDFPYCVPVATQVPHASGVALAFKLRHEERAAVCMVGDGGTSEGNFHEGLNFAGAMQLPAVFVVANNQWAISTPRAAQTGSETIAQKAFAAGMPGVQVDGNDVIAVRAETTRALERARSGGGPTLIEALTYRLGDHTTSDDARRYRDDAEVSAAWQADPMARLRTYLERSGWWRSGDEQALVAAVRDEIEAASGAYLATEPLPPESMFDHLFATLPSALAIQRAEVAARAAHAAGAAGAGDAGRGG